MIYPWQENQWQQLQKHIADGRLPHAILLKGAEGLGKLVFARTLAEAILCRQPDSTGQACGKCEACQLLAAGTHPDLQYLEPEEDLKPIKVDDIRELCASLTMTSQYGGYTVAIIALADNMNINASNSLLKTLEEPSESTLLILVSSRPERLPITIRSRCQAISFSRPETAIAEQWLKQQGVAAGGLSLQLAHGSPLLALKLADEELQAYRKVLLEALVGVANRREVTEYAAALAKIPGPYLLGWLYDWISDLLKLHQTGQAAPLTNSDYQKQLQQFVAKSSPQGLYDLLDEVVQLKKLQSIPLNSQMLWEDLLISWDRQLKRV